MGDMIRVIAEGLLGDTDQDLEDLVSELGESLPASSGNVPDESGVPFIPLEMRAGEETLRFLSSITTLGAPQDVSLQELRIEAYFPADELTDRETRREFAALATGGDDTLK